MTAPTSWPPHCQLWPLDPYCLPQGWSADPAQWTPAQARAVALASEWLWLATGKAFGQCLYQQRPCRRTCAEGYVPDTGPGPLNPVLVNGQVINLTCACTGSCGCGPFCEVKLQGPVASIVRVQIDGQTVPDSTYRVDNGYLLVRQGPGCWPDCQDLSKPEGEPGTWSVTYYVGTPIPPLGRLAVTQLAVEFAKACAGDTDCVLPERVVQVSRQGVTYDLESGPRETNLKLVDDWVSLVNPYGIAEDMAIYSPDVQLGRTQTWPTPQYIVPTIDPLTGQAPRINVHHHGGLRVGVIPEPVPPTGQTPDFHLHQDPHGNRTIAVEVQP